MASGKRICKICGKEYEYCKTLRETPGVFRWQDVACCVEHGEKYFDLIMASRGKRNETSESEVNAPAIESEITVQKPKSTRRKRKVEE